MKKSIIKVTVALGIILGGLIPFSYVIDIDEVAHACGSKDKSADEGNSGSGSPEST